jgi:hypothetical protein
MHAIDAPPRQTLRALDVLDYDEEKQVNQPLSILGMATLLAAAAALGGPIEILFVGSSFTFGVA